MQLHRLEAQEDFSFCDPVDDVRGWTAEDPDGRLLGVVVELLVDPDSHVVQGLILENGAHYLHADYDVSPGLHRTVTIRKRH